MIFKDWRLLDRSPVPLGLDKDYIYYIHARAWALKGYLGGTHSWTAFWSNEHNKWLVAEVTDKETLEVQRANVVYTPDESLGNTTRAIFISDRDPTEKWFGATPIVVGKALNTVSYNELVNTCQRYPLLGFDLFDNNCNTFTSYLLFSLNLEIEKPFRSIGFKTRYEWLTHQYYGMFYNGLE